MFTAGLIVGLALGLIVIGFLAIAAYERGYDEAIGKRKQWRAELVARRAAAQRVLAAFPARKAS
jgi:predicted membrane chloride channel (bestrophin family)